MKKLVLVLALTIASFTTTNSAQAAANDVLFACTHVGSITTGANFNTAKKMVNDGRTRDVSLALKFGENDRPVSVFVQEPTVSFNYKVTGLSSTTLYAELTYVEGERITLNKATGRLTSSIPHDGSDLVTYWHSDCVIKKALF